LYLDFFVPGEEKHVINQTTIAQNQAFARKTNWLVTTGVYCLSILVVILACEEFANSLFGDTQQFGCFSLIAVAGGQRSQKKLLSHLR
jgi:hypothetical protein